MPKHSDKNVLKILAVFPHICRPDTSSGDLRFVRLLEILSSFANVDLLVPQNRWRNQQNDHYWNSLEEKGIRIVDPSLWSRFELLCTAEHYDLILVEFWYQAERLMKSVASLKRSNPNLKLITDTVDIHFLRELAEWKLYPSADPSKLKDIQERMQRELWTYSQSDLVIVVTQEDQRALIENQCTVPSELVPNIVSPSTRTGNPDPNCILFIGGFRHKPNVDAVLWFVHDIFPLIKKKLPNAIFRIVGSHPTAQILELNRISGVQVVGFVKDTTEMINAASVSVAPLRYGAGMKGKVTEALSFGLPVVTTSFGSQGLNAIDGEHLRIADDAIEFAEHVYECLTSPSKANQMGQRGQELIANLCGPESIKTRLESLLKKDFGCSVDPISRRTRLLAQIRCKMCSTHHLVSEIANQLLSRFLRRR